MLKRLLRFYVTDNKVSARVTFACEELVIIWELTFIIILQALVCKETIK